MVDLRNFVFEDATFDRATLEHLDLPARGSSSEPACVASRSHLGLFTDATFAKGADFREVRFPGFAIFDRATFHDEALFRDANFEAWARFERSEFHGNTVFIDASFTDGVAFIDTSFGGSVTFRDADVHGQMTFSKVTFADEAVFSDARFHDMVFFEEDSFLSSADFRGSSFMGSVTFAADFRGPVTFGDRLNVPVFGGRVTLVDTTFHDAADFGRTTFIGRAMLRDVVFGEHAHFVGARFERLELFGPVWVEGVLALDRAVFVEPVVIEASAQVVSMDRTMFLGGVDLLLRWGSLLRALTLHRAVADRRDGDGCQGVERAARLGASARGRGVVL